MTGAIGIYLSPGCAFALSSSTIKTVDIDYKQFNSTVNSNVFCALSGCTPSIQIRSYQKGITSIRLPNWIGGIRLRVVDGIDARRFLYLQLILSKVYNNNHKYSNHRSAGVEQYLQSIPTRAILLVIGWVFKIVVVHPLLFLVVQYNHVI